MISVRKIIWDRGLCRTGSGILLLLMLSVLLVQDCKRFEPQGYLLLVTEGIEFLGGMNYRFEGTFSDLGPEKISQHGFCWSTNPKPTHEDFFSESGARVDTGTYTYTVEGLDCGTVYYVRAYAIIADEASYGRELEFVTGDCGAPSVQTYVVNSISSNSARIGGGVVDDMGTHIESKGLLYGTSPDPFMDGVKVEVGEGSEAFEVTLKGLESNTFYYIQAYATNASGTGYGWVNSFTTRAPGPGDKLAFAATYFMHDWDLEPSYDGVIGYNDHPYDKAFCAVRQASDGWSYEGINDAGTFDKTWEVLPGPNFCRNMISNGVAGDPFDLDTDSPTYGYAWKGIHFDRKLYIFIKALDLERRMGKGSLFFEIMDQPTSNFRHEPTFDAAQDSLEENRIAYENMAYARYIELGGGLAEFGPELVTRYEASIGLEKHREGNSYLNGNWGKNIRGYEALQAENHLWLDDGEGTIRAVYVMPFDGVLSYPQDPSNLDGAWESVQVGDVISFDIKGVAYIEGGAGADATLSYIWSSDHNNCWSSNYYAGKLFLYDQVIDLPVFN